MLQAPLVIEKLELVKEKLTGDLEKNILDQLPLIRDKLKQQAMICKSNDL